MKADHSTERERVIVKTSVVGIITNVFLAIFKAIIGVFSNSIAVILDAVNNLSDAMSSVITLVGAKLGARQPDKKHPLGYGRMEYLSAMIVAGIVLYAGITSVVESVKKIIKPENAEYSMISLIILVVAILAKFILSQYVKKQGKRVNSSALIASGTDAAFDVILSLSVVVSVIIYMITGISLEAYVGLAISVFIIKSGIEMIIETVNDLIGQRYNGELSLKIREIINAEPDVHGAYDLILYNYGPDKYYGSVHIELPDIMTVNDVDSLTRKIQEKVYDETKVILTGIGVYSYNTSNSEAADIRNRIQQIVMSHDWSLQMHGFYVDVEAGIIRFDVVLSFEIGWKEALQILKNEVQEAYPDYRIEIIPDADITE